MDWFMGKGRRKDKDSTTTINTEEQKEYLEDPNIKERISDADLFRLVALPPMLDLNEWLATHTIAFFNHVNLIYGVISEYCSTETCPSMTAPDNVQYFWYDDKGKKSKHTAAQYIDYVMTHIQKVINDESVFPTKFDHPFPPDLKSIVKRINKYLFHVLAHIYHAHYKLLRQLGLHAHLNTVFTHFMVFTCKFDLVQDKESDILLQLFSLLLKNLADPNQNPTLREGLGIGDGVLGPPYDKPSDCSNTTKEEATMDHISATSPQSLSNGGGNLTLPLSNTTSTTRSLHDNDTPMEHNGLEKNRHPSSSSPIHSPTSHEEKNRDGNIMMDTDRSKSPSEWLSNLQVSAT
uniref:Uncharacterized protein n=1 Tax=Arion vulgaris TaxID=1028688 RepID=A0A0B6Y3U2_9EUPU